MAAWNETLAGSLWRYFVLVLAYPERLVWSFHARDYRTLPVSSCSRNSDLVLPLIRALPITAASSGGILFLVAFYSCPGTFSRGLLSPFCGQAACW